MHKHLQLTTLILIGFHIISMNSQVNTMKNEYLQIFDNFVGIENQEIINGRNYAKQILTIKNSHLFFKSPNFIKSQITYKDLQYVIPLKYDIFNDLVIIQNHNENKKYAISLTSKLVQQFTIQNHIFIKLPKQKKINLFYGNGFFEKVFQGNSIIYYIKHYKKRNRDLSSNKTRYIFSSKHILILKVNTNYNRITSKKDLIKVLPNSKIRINDFFKNNKINSASLLQFLKQVD